MKRRCSALAILALSSFTFAQNPQTAQTETPAHKAAMANVHHEADFDAKRKQAVDLVNSHHDLEALPLCADLVRQDPADGGLAECYAHGLIARAGTEIGTPEYERDHDEALAQLKRAADLGNNSNFVLAMIDLMNGRTGSNTPGYDETKIPEAKAALNQGEAAFSRRDTKAAFAAYAHAADLDPTYYTAKLFAGDACFTSGDYACAGEWFAKAIALDPNRETAYRYWADALYKSGKSHEALQKYEQGIVAEPFSRLSWNGLLQWAQLTKTQMDSLVIPRPKIDSTNNKINVTIAPNGSAAEMTAWLVYAGCRAGDAGKDKSGKTPLPAYTPELESKCLFLAADALASTKDADLTPALRNLLALKHDGMIECWVRLNSTDDGATAGYANYRNTHRDLLIAYLDKYVVHEGVTAKQPAQISAPPPKQ